MKKIYLLLAVILILVGCGKYTTKDATKDLEKKINKLKSYTVQGNLSIKNNDETYKYNVDVVYKKEDNFKVSLTNQTNNHKQIILKNSSGVYVLNPNLNKSFKFQSDWPYNNSQTYLLQTLLTDIQNDNKKQFKETSKNYIFETKVNYPNNTSLIKQKIYLDKNQNIKKVQIMNKKSEVIVQMIFNKIKYNPNIPKNTFNLEKNLQVSKTTEQTKPVSKIDSDTYPMYIPNNTKLSQKKTINLDKGQRVIMTFEGDNPFMFIQETAQTDNNITSIYGDPYMLATSVAAVSDNMISWLSNGVEYYIVADKMSQSELMNVASSVTTMPITK